MDLNYLFHRHQISLVAASTAGSAEARLAHRGLAAAYARCIGMLRAGTGGVALMGSRVS
jgi:hypothetical protein